MCFLRELIDQQVADIRERDTMIDVRGFASVGIWAYCEEGDLKFKTFLGGCQKPEVHGDIQYCNSKSEFDWCLYPLSAGGSYDFNVGEIYMTWGKDYLKKSNFVLHVICRL